MGLLYLYLLLKHLACVSDGNILCMRLSFINVHYEFLFLIVTNLLYKRYISYQITVCFFNISIILLMGHFFDLKTSAWSCSQSTLAARSSRLSGDSPAPAFKHRASSHNT
jgi:hypothetical protein